MVFAALTGDKEARAPDIHGPLAPPVAAPDGFQACELFLRRMTAASAPVARSASVVGSGTVLVI